MDHTHILLFIIPFGSVLSFLIFSEGHRKFACFFFVTYYLAIMIVDTYIELKPKEIITEQGLTKKEVSNA